jgi:hypothetical protein
MSDDLDRLIREGGPSANEELVRRLIRRGFIRAPDQVIFAVLTSAHLSVRAGDMLELRAEYSRNLGIQGYWFTGMVPGRTYDIQARIGFINDADTPATATIRWTSDESLFGTPGVLSVRPDMRGLHEVSTRAIYAPTSEGTSIALVVERVMGFLDVCDQATWVMIKEI